MAGSTNSIVARNVLRGRLSEDNLMAGAVGTAYNPTYAIVTEAGAQIVLYINSSNYQFYAELKDKYGNHISNSNIIDLPLESMVVDGSYDAETKEVVLTLNNGNEVRFSVADLVEGLVSTEQLNTILGDYVKFTDYAETAKAGVIKTSNSYATTTSSGVLTSQTKTYEQYNSLNNNSFISKGTLENVITGKELTNKEYVDAADEVFENDLFGDVEVSDNGESITLNNTLESALDIELDGNTSQTTVAPVEGSEVVNTSINVSDVDDSKENYITLKGNTYQYSTTGKNKFNVSDKAQTIHQYGITYKVENNIFTITGTNTSSSAYSLISWTNGQVQTHLDSIFQKGKTFTLSANNSLSGLYFQINYFKEGSSSQSQLTNLSGLGGKATFTIPQDFDHTGNVFLGVYANATTINGSFSFQLEEGSAKTDFEPYTNGASPNPDYPQEIQVVSGDNTIKVEGKNLISSYTKNAGNQIYFNGVSDYSNNFIFKPGTYTFSYINNGSNSIFTFIKEKGDASSTNKGGGNPITFTTTKEFNIWLYRNGMQESEVSQPQLEKGSQATTYEPYKGATYPINLPEGMELCKIGEYQDRIYKNNDKWYIEKQIGKVVLDGSENNWKSRLQSLSPFTGFYEYYYMMQNLKANYTNLYCLSNNFKYSSSEDGTLTNEFRLGGYTTAKNGNVLFNFGDIEDKLNDFKTWLSNNNTEVYYVLNTPTAIEITDTTLLSQLNTLYTAQIYNGTTNISTEANDLLPYIDLKYNVITASPSPDKPSDIQVVSGDNEVKVEGKNLFNINATHIDYHCSSTVIDNAITITQSDTYPSARYTLDNLIVGETYTITASYVKPEDGQIAIRVYDNNTLVATTGNISSPTTGNMTFTFTATATTEIRIYARVISGTNTSDVTYSNIMIEQNNQATPYQPYQGQSYEIDLRTSKNIFDITKILKNKDLKKDTGQLRDTTGWYASDWIAIKPNTAYTSSNINSDIKCWYDKNKTFISYTNTTTATSPANAKYLRVNGTLASIESNPNLMIEEGDTASTYEAYSSIELCKIGEYQDKIVKDNGSWYLHKEIGKLILNGTEDWTKSSGGGRKTGYYTNDYPTLRGNSYDSYSNYFICDGTSTAWRGLGTFGWSSANTLWFEHTDTTNITTKTAWIDWLSTHNTIVYYVLATPTSEEITDTTLINQLNDLEKANSYDEQTNISQVNNDMPFELAATAFIDSTAGKLAVTAAQINTLNETDDNLSANKEDKSNKVATISASSTDIEYPTAKCVYDIIGDVESLLETLDIGSGV